MFYSIRVLDKYFDKTFKMLKRYYVFVITVKRIVYLYLNAITIFDIFHHLYERVIRVEITFSSGVQLR